MITTTQSILRSARHLEDISPGFVANAIFIETGEDCGGRDVLGQVARLIEMFGVVGASQILGCRREAGRTGRER